MKLITLDFETYFDDSFSLKKLTTEEYIRDPRFEAHGAAVRFDSGTLLWHDAKQLAEMCEVWRSQQRQGTRLAFLAHHAHFDGLILSHHFGFRPDFWLDTLSMGRVVFDSGLKLGLGSLAARLGLKEKNVPYDLFKGKHWHELDRPTQDAAANGAIHDCELTWQIADIMLRGGHPAVPYAFPASELPVVDMTVKMFTEPVLVGDLDLLGQAWTHENQAKAELFAELNTTGDLLRQDKQFAEMLRDLGIEPELKTTAKGNEKYAFAKSDYFMQDLLMHEDERVALLAEARLKAQSSIYQTRAERYGWIATRGPFPIYLAYCAAHTRRWGGGDKQNAQNMPRPDPGKPQKGALRRAIKVP